MNFILEKMYQQVYTPKYTCKNVSICDMIKGNESDDGNIDFELQAKIDDKCLCIILFSNIKESVISLQPDV